jgi:hypothetical protein
MYNFSEIQKQQKIGTGTEWQACKARTPRKVVKSFSIKSCQSKNTMEEL